MQRLFQQSINETVIKRLRTPDTGGTEDLFLIKNTSKAVDIDQINGLFVNWTKRGKNYNSESDVKDMRLRKYDDYSNFHGEFFMYVEINGTNNFI